MLIITLEMAMQCLSGATKFMPMLESSPFLEASTQQKPACLNAAIANKNINSGNDNTLHNSRSSASSSSSSIKNIHIYQHIKN